MKSNEKAKLTSQNASTILKNGIKWLCTSRSHPWTAIQNCARCSFAPQIQAVAAAWLGRSQGCRSKQCHLRSHFLSFFAASNQLRISSRLRLKRKGWTSPAGKEAFTVSSSLEASWGVNREFSPPGPWSLSSKMKNQHIGFTYGFVWKCWVNIPENRVYSQWNSHLIGIMISKTIGYNGVLTIFRHTLIWLNRVFLAKLLCAAADLRVSSSLCRVIAGFNLCKKSHKCQEWRMPRKMKMLWEHIPYIPLQKAPCKH